MGKRLWKLPATPLPRLALLALVLFAALVLAGCGQPGVERVDVTWQTDPPPKWGLYPGYRQEIPCPIGAAYLVEMIVKGKVYTSGTVRSFGRSVLFTPASGAQGISAQSEGDRLALVVTLPADKGERVRQTAVFISKNSDKIFFEVPK